jgi:hypothetical protein
MIHSSQIRYQTTLRALSLLLFASCGQLASLKGSATTNVSSPTDASASPGDLVSAAAPSGGSAHDTFAVLDVKIGMPVEGQPGFTCTKPKPGKELEDVHCVKFLDKRCAGKPTNIGTLRYGEDAPAGCYLDYSNAATYLDSSLQQTANTGDTTDPAQRNPRKPLTNLHITGTQSKPSKIYEIWYTFPPDDLGEDSKLYKAMTAKYGEPSYKNAPTEMRWSRDDTKLKAECSRDRQCQILVQDSKFGGLERRKQEEADARARRQNAAAPQL